MIGRLAIAAAAGVLLALLPRMRAASAAPAHDHDLGPLPNYAPADPQSTCSPSPKPGTTALMDYVVATYGGRSGGIFRSCDRGGPSEHKEGRAWDWFPPNKAAGDRLVADFLARDAQGRPHATARRWGLQYFIWWRKLWSSSKARRDGDVDGSGWKPYTRTGSVTARHEDHIHFSQSRAASKRGAPEGF